MTFVYWEFAQLSQLARLHIAPIDQLTLCHRTEHHIHSSGANQGTRTHEHGPARVPVKSGRRPAPQRISLHNHPVVHGHARAIHGHIRSCRVHVWERIHIAIS